VAIYYLHVNIIGRSSGRSSVGASAYRSGEKLRIVESASYRSGEELYDENVKMTHDYTQKGGIAHTEIMLPQNAPKKFTNRETLWNAVEQSEKRKDARLAREIIIALPREFNLEEQKAVLREYIQENFVDEGMCADLAIHDKGDGNPHAHIMLTTRDVTPDGFGKKNINWNNQSELLKWRKRWADITNDMFEEKELDIRIDHRSYKAQGIDREPTIHMGHEAWALEKKGIKTEKGDYNREIERRNREREAETEEDVHTKEAHLLKERATEETARHMNQLKKDYFNDDKERYMLKESRNKDNQNLVTFRFQYEEVEERTDNTQELEGSLEELQAKYQNLSFWQWTQKADIKRAIAQIKQKLERAKKTLWDDYHIEPDEAQEELARIYDRIKTTERDIGLKTARIQALENTLTAIELEYQTEKLLAQTRPDKYEIEKILAEIKRPPEQSIRDKQRFVEIERKLDYIPEKNFQKIIEKLPENQAKFVTDVWNKDRPRKKERIYQKERER
jgi:ATP-dependent exoDNAse (exonuclease V) alpha subunit